MLARSLGVHLPCHSFVGGQLQGDGTASGRGSVHAPVLCPSSHPRGCAAPGTEPGAAQPVRCTRPGGGYWLHARVWSALGPRRTRGWDRRPVGLARTPILECGSRCTYVPGAFRRPSPRNDCSVYSGDGRASDGFAEGKVPDAPPWPPSGRMSIRHPVSRAASRAFCPSRPIASDSW